MAIKKTDQNALARIMAGFAKHNADINVETIEEQIKPLYTQETIAYTGQAILNFFEGRIKPRLNKGENEASFDARYREWRIKKCGTCNEEFAYAWRYDGVKNCSMECLEKALKEIGITLTRDRDLTLRYGVYSHPAIVPAAAFAVLKENYQESAPDAFVSSPAPLPKSLSHSSPQ